jgi:hypothetical protein
MLLCQSLFYVSKATTYDVMNFYLISDSVNLCVVG